jgi:hypothetical protein
VHFAESEEFAGRSVLRNMPNRNQQAQRRDRGTAQMKTMVTAAATLTAQEEAIEKGKKVLHRNVADWALRIYEAFRGYGPPRVTTLDRAVPFTEEVQMS